MSYRYEGNGKFTDNNEKKQTAGKQDDPWATQPKPKKTQSDKPSNSDMGSWIFIAFMFAVAWPIGLILLISKLGEKDGKSKKAPAASGKTQSKPESKTKAAAVARSGGPRERDGARAAGDAAAPAVDDAGTTGE